MTHAQAQASLLRHAAARPLGGVRPGTVNNDPSAVATQPCPDLKPAPVPSAFAHSLLALPSELLTHILLFLAPDDLGTLSRTVPLLAGVEQDAYLWNVWVHKTAPSRIGHALFSPLSQRPDPLELVRRGTLRGMAVVSGVRNQGYWASEPAVRLSRIHDNLTRATVRRALTAALSPDHRPAPTTLVAAGILPPAAARGASASICAKAHALERAQQRDAVRRRLVADGVGRRFADVAASGVGVWEDGGERVVLALCPGIRDKRRFYESLAV